MRIKQPNEKPLECAHRELFEETGYKTDQMITYTHQTVYFIDDEPLGNHDNVFLEKLLNEIETIVFIVIIKDPKDPVLSLREHTAWKWCDFSTTYNLVGWAFEKKQHKIIRKFILVFYLKG